LDKNLSEEVDFGKKNFSIKIPVETKKLGDKNEIGETKKFCILARINLIHLEIC